MRINHFNSSINQRRDKQSFGLRFNMTTLKALQSSPDWEAFKPIVIKAQNHVVSDVYMLTIPNILRHKQDVTAGIQAEFVPQINGYKPVTTETYYGPKALQEVMSHVLHFVERF